MDDGHWEANFEWGAREGILAARAAMKASTLTCSDGSLFPADISHATAVVVVSRASVRSNASFSALNPCRATSCCSSRDDPANSSKSQIVDSAQRSARRAWLAAVFNDKMVTSAS